VALLNLNALVKVGEEQRVLRWAVTLRVLLDLGQIGPIGLQALIDQSHLPRIRLVVGTALGALGQELRLFAFLDKVVHVGLDAGEVAAVPLLAVVTDQDRLSQRDKPRL
jgi:hypothetical protein